MPARFEDTCVVRCSKGWNGMGWGCLALRGRVSVCWEDCGITIITTGFGENMKAPYNSGMGT